MDSEKWTAIKEEKCTGCGRTLALSKEERQKPGGEKEHVTLSLVLPVLPGDLLWRSTVPSPNSKSKGSEDSNLKSPGSPF